jgi:hypothetical protein
MTEEAHRMIHAVKLLLLFLQEVVEEVLQPMGAIALPMDHIVREASEPT